MSEQDAGHTPKTDRAEGSGAKVRLQRHMADAGVAARRVCEQMIEQGRVTVNGETLTRLPVLIDPAADRIEVDGRLLPRVQPSRTLVVYKPPRVLVSSSDEMGMERTTILDLVQLPHGTRVFPVGRLGWDDAGLVVLTSDGEIAHALSHPRFGVPKRYEVVVSGIVGSEEIAKIQRQAKLFAKAAAFESRQEMKREAGGGPVLRRGNARGGGLEVVVLQQEADRTVLGITMSDAKGKPLRDILFACGLPVRKLTRVAIGPLSLRGLTIGGCRDLSPDEVRLVRAIAESGRYDEQRAQRLLARSAGKHPDERVDAGTWPAPIVRNTPGSVRAGSAVKRAGNNEQRSTTMAAKKAGKKTAKKVSKRPPMKTMERSGKPLTERAADKRFEARASVPRGQRGPASRMDGGAPRNQGRGPTRGPGRGPAGSPGRSGKGGKGGKGGGGKGGR